ncbi:unnamed protein product [Phytomonas sp. Hart1]|nr:unnamed protein product [Phytomonas sp. Hart1]|eukprot:CCW69629.1 unnamed protein product [Phytomonas sp. isolate Hart1]
MHPGLSSLLRTLQLQKSEKRTITSKQFAACVTLLFPDPPKRQSAGRPSDGLSVSASRYVSPGWQNALTLLELSRYCDPPSAQKRISKPHHSVDAVETETTERILNLGRFPLHPDGWTTALSVLERWRQLQGPEYGKSFPNSLSVEAAADLAYLVSFSKPTGEGVTPSWQEVLSLYQYAVRHTIDSSDNSRSFRSLLQGMRHTVSSALLHSGEWLKALHLFKHALYQHDAPDSVSTGHLIHNLGKKQQWEAVMEIYELCVALLQRERATPKCRRSVELQWRLAKQWGTTFSMAMTTVSKEGCQPHLLKSMLKTLLQDSNKLSPLPSSSRSGFSIPLAQLDGNFLEAVQSVENERERVEILEEARQANILDYYKLIRGLTSKGKLDEAMAVFTKSMQSDPPSLSRREIGLSRLHLLHISSLEHVEKTVEALQQVRNRKQSFELLLNNAEVECILSKTLQATTSPPVSSLPTSSTSMSTKEIGASNFWRYCLQILQKTYVDFWQIGAKASRKPTLASLSFILRNESLPWQIALLIVNKQKDLPDESPPSESRNQWDTLSSSTTIVSGNTHKAQSVPTRVLLLNAAARLLYNQGQSSKADDLSLSIIRDFQVSPSATFLMRCSWSMLVQVLLQDGVSVDSRVLYHILHDCRHDNSQDLSYSLRPFVIVSFLIDMHASGGTENWLPDTVLSLIEVDVDLKQLLSKRKKQVLDASFGSNPQKQPSCRSWLMCVPGSIHVEILKRLKEPVPWADEELRWELVVSYISRLTPSPLPVATEATSDSNPSEKMHERYYCTVYEAVLTLLTLLPKLSSAAPAKSDIQVATEPLGDDLARPSPSVQKHIRLLQGLIGHATAQLRFSPPPHMLLPNQTDRLLPRPPTEKGRGSLVDPIARCAVAEALVRSSCQVLQGHVGGPGRGLTSPGPVTLHSLVKLCCRVAEWRKELGLTGQTGEAMALEACAQELIQRQGDTCGIHTVYPSSLHLLYKLCAVRGRQWERALQVTKYLIELEKRVNQTEETNENNGVDLPEDSLYKRVNQEHAHRMMRVVQPSHYQAFQRLFGWEHGLQLWFDHFPSEVIQRVSENPAALNWCLSASDTGKK